MCAIRDFNQKSEHYNGVSIRSPLALLNLSPDEWLCLSHLLVVAAVCVIHMILLLVLRFSDLVNGTAVLRFEKDRFLLQLHLK